MKTLKIVLVTFDVASFDEADRTAIFNFFGVRAGNAVGDWQFVAGARIFFWDRRTR